MIKRTLAAAAAWLALGAMQAAPLPPPARPLAPLSLWRLDCGNFIIKDFNAFFSDTMAYRPGPKDIASSCYLIRHGTRYMLWDTGVEAAIAARPVDSAAAKISLRRTLVAQLAEINVRPDQIATIGISHYHSDHIGQAASFPGARLLIGDGDWAALKANAGGRARPELVAPWLSGGGKATQVSGDLDIFGDGQVIMLDTPGHTPGHHSLLVRLASGPVILSGDLWHFTEQVPIDGVPPFNTDRADTLASMDRITRMARNIGAKIVIQHEPGDIAKLPPFPDAAK